MKKITRHLLTVAFSAFIAVATGLCESLSAAEAAKPNIVFILADDLGWRDLGCYGSTFHETPNIDRLAARGVMFTQAYADSPLCSPTRASIQTGLHPARIGITAPACHENFVRLEKKLGDPDPKSKVLQAKSLTRLKTEYFTLAEAFREAGYTTAHFGKWHIGHNLPNRKNDRFEPKNQGFESDFPHTPTVGGPVTGFFAPWKFIKDPPLEGNAGEHIEDRMSSEAEKFILAHASTGSEQAKKPFYLNYCAYSVHMPAQGKSDYVEHFKKRADPKNPQNNPVYAAMVKSLDDAVGRLMNAVDQAGIADRTIIVFFSDNGGNVDPPKVTVPEGYENRPLACNYPLRSGKLSLYEGGTREPCIIVWPGKIKPGTENGALFQSVDFYPTLLAMCGLKPHADIKLDGLNQEGTLLGGASPRDRIFCHFPHGNEKIPIPGFLPGTYVRKGDWKLIRFYADNDDGSDRLELYNLKDDVGETRNLAPDNPEIVKDLNGLISGFLKDTDAVIPVRNPDYIADAKQTPSGGE